jgi:hypothetical protein
MLHIRDSWPHLGRIVLALIGSEPYVQSMASVLVLGVRFEIVWGSSATTDSVMVGR